MENYLRIANWERWQTYRSDRGKPPWIKVWKCLLHNPEWVGLTDAQRGQLVTMWLLAGNHDGTIPASPVILKKLCHMDSEPDLELYMSLGFIESGQVVTSGLPTGDKMTGQFSTVQGSEDRNKRGGMGERKDVGVSPIYGPTTAQPEMFTVYRHVQCKDGTGTILKSSVQDWIRAFPRLDVPGTVEQACVWQEAALKWTARGLNRAIVAWLARELKKAPTSVIQSHRPSFDNMPEMPLSYDPADEA